jgi:hypothetical protein
MKKKIFTFLASIIMMSTVVVDVSAQDVVNIWHAVALVNGEEVASYNTEKITGMTVASSKVTITLDNGKEFPHPVAATNFVFELRADGTGTANEIVEVSKWSVYYANGSLHFSETASDISVYTVYGALIARFAGNHSEVPVSLSQGLYIVQAGDKSAKLPVSRNGIGGTTVQVPQASAIATRAAVDPPDIIPRAGTIRIYWNIRYGDGSVIPVEIANVESFRFTEENTIVFTLANGNTIELADYQGMEFTIEPTPVTTNSKWDLEKTLKFGGASYWFNSNPIYEPRENFMCMAAVTTEGVIIHFFPNSVLNGDVTFPNSAITYSGFWDLDGRLTAVKFPYSDLKLCKVMPHRDARYADMLEYIRHDSSTGKNDYSTDQKAYSFNGGTPSLHTIIKIDGNGGMYMKFESLGEIFEYTFPVPTP